MSTLTKAQKIQLVDLLIELDQAVNEAQINYMKYNSKIESRRLKEKWQKWLEKQN